MLYDLKDEQWERIKNSLPGKEGDRGRSAKDNRRFVAAIMWIGRTGATWRALPAEYGKWSSVHKRFIRWAKSGVWQMIFNTLAVNGDTEWLMIDSTIIRAHQHAAGARKMWKLVDKNKSWDGAKEDFQANYTLLVMLWATH
ncbi:hypothetical protein wHma_08260 [Wolbachia pipientis]|nr:hypothetical protein wHma_02600 [Wolbachia pipientis]GKS78819.1 hypothetical protein wHma_08260 [Wolbachia pipientis]